MRVLEAGPTRVVWESIAIEGIPPTGHTLEWLGTTMEFDIAPAGNGTELRFRHVGLTPELECWDACVAAWTQFIGEHRDARPRPAPAPRSGPETLDGLAESARRPRRRMRCCGRLPIRTADRSCGSFSMASCRRARSPPVSPSPSRQSVSTSPCSNRRACSASAVTEPAASTRFTTEALEPVRDLLSEFWPDALGRLKKAVETAHPRPPRRQP